MSIALQTLKRTVKRQIRMARRRIVRRVYAFNGQDLLAGLRRLGIAEGDTVLVHSSFDSFGAFLGSPMDVNSIVCEAVGRTGHVLMPTIPFTGAAIDYVSTNPVFNVRTTPSRTGLLTELFRRQPGIVRSVHPTHSVAVSGPDAEKVVEDHHLAKTPCGRPSPYSRLLDRDGKILFLGTDIRPFTFYHFIEEEIEALIPFPVFTETLFVLRSIDQHGAELVTQTRLFDKVSSSRRNMKKLVSHLQERHMWKTQRIGSVPCATVKAADAATVCRELAAKGMYLYDRPS